jgi:hypothetical protein
MKRGLSGWQRRSMNQYPEVTDEPSGFDVLLERLRITEKEAPRHPDVRKYVYEHYRTSFVPEKVLSALGVTADFVL